MNHTKPFVHDYGKPKSAKNVLFERVEGAMNKLKAKGYLGLGLYGQHVEEDY